MSCRTFLFGVRVSSNTEDVDSALITIGKYYGGDNQDNMDPFAIYISEYERTGWKQNMYVGETVRRVQTRTSVIDELNRILAEYRSNANPVRVVGEVMYAVNNHGSGDPWNSRYSF
jgi:hypothetical protein